MASTHLFSGGTLSRISKLRTNLSFLRASLKAPTTRFLALKGLDPLVVADPASITHGDKLATVAWVGYEDVKEVVDADSGSGTVVVLGMDDQDEVGSVVEDAGKGRVYWAVDVSDHSSVISRLTSTGRIFAPLRANLAYFCADGASPQDSALIAQARALLDWNARNQFCPACGRLTVGLEAGYKRACPRIQPDQSLENSDSAGVAAGTGGVEVTKQPACLSHSGVHNFQYPRTDPVVIVAVMHPTDSDKILLGRQKRLPPGMYTCVAGFMEAGETLEEACAREIHEETGVRVQPSSVIYHSSQPWPFPNSIMIGCIATAQLHPDGTVDQPDVASADGELEDARWISRSDMQGAVDAHSKPSGNGNVNSNGQWEAGKTGEPSKSYRIPPPYAIAHHLIKAWVAKEEVNSYRLGAASTASKI
ncbi:NUDIX hydrolase domain-like protein [Phlyctochytrium arcticum]|nr:NUDIX hydrolase domain-like protein [Phlyctochytrium arcticum]